MNERQKILLAIVSFLAIAGLVVLLLLPSRTVSKSMDFYIHDSNGNNQLEVNEMIQFIVNDSSNLEGKTVLWKMWVMVTASLGIPISGINTQRWGNILSRFR